MGVEGHRHRAQLRRRRATGRAGHGVPPRGRPARHRGAVGGLRRPPPRPDDRGRPADPGRRRRPVRRARGRADGARRRARARTGRDRGGRHGIRARPVRRRGRLPRRGVHRAAAQPHRRRADDVRPGQLRALPPQDLQRRLRRRRRGAAPLAVRDDPAHRGGRGRGHRRRLQGQRLGHGRRAARALDAGVRRRPEPLRRARGRGPRAHEGRDAQPPDRDQPVPRCRDRCRRRDPRRGCDGPRLAAEGRPHRVRRVEPPPARARRAVGAGALRRACAHREPARDHGRGADRGRGLQQRVRAAGARAASSACTSRPSTASAAASTSRS